MLREIFQSDLVSERIKEKTLNVLAMLVKNEFDYHYIDIYDECIIIELDLDATIYVKEDVKLRSVIEGSNFETSLKQLELNLKYIA